METNSYDLYLNMEQEAEDRNSKQIFKTLSEEEKKHLERLTSLFLKKLQKDFFRLLTHHRVSVSPYLFFSSVS